MTAMSPLESYADNDDDSNKFLYHTYHTLSILSFYIIFALLNIIVGRCPIFKAIRHTRDPALTLTSNLFSKTCAIGSCLSCSNKQVNTAKFYQILLVLFSLANLSDFYIYNLLVSFLTN